MSHSLNKIWIHAIWSTKGRLPLIHPSIENKIYESIAAQFKEQGCMVKIINGMPDHVHCLFLLNRKKSIAEVIKKIKGSTSHTINQSNLIPQKFAWQTGYAAYSVSESGLSSVYNYIKRQKQRHRKKKIHREYDRLV